jgi:hypothetical protein
MKNDIFIPARITCLTVVLAAITGCAYFRPKTPKPLPPPLTRDAVIRQLHAKTKNITTLADARAKTTIWQLEKDSSKAHKISFGTVLAIDRSLPGIWLRAEKLGQKLFELRANGESFWLELPDTKELITGSGPAYGKLPQLIKPAEAALWLANPDQLGLTWDSTEMRVTDSFYVFNVKSVGIRLRSVYVNRKTLNINKIITWDILGEKTQQITMSSYKPHNHNVFPFEVSIYRPEYGIGITVRLKNPKFNKKLPGRTFQSRSRPGWRHVNLDYEPAYNIKALEKYR